MGRAQPVLGEPALGLGAGKVGREAPAGQQQRDESGAEGKPSRQVPCFPEAPARPPQNRHLIHIYQERPNYRAWRF